MTKTKRDFDEDRRICAEITTQQDSFNAWLSNAAFNVSARTGWPAALAYITALETQVEHLDEKLTEANAEIAQKDYWYHSYVAAVLPEIRKRDSYQTALLKVSKVGYSDLFGGGTHYSGESHAECIRIAKEALK